MRRDSAACASFEAVFIGHDIEAIRKGVVQVYDCIGSNVLILARMYERRLKGYEAIGYTVEPRLLASSADLTG